MAHLGKILGIDYGEKRCGLAMTDSARIVAAPLKTVDTKLIFTEIENLIEKEKIALVVVGEARYLNGDSSSTTELQRKFCLTLQRKFPQIKVR